MPAPSKSPSEDEIKFSQEDEKEFQQIHQEIVDKLKPANAEEEKLYAGLAAHLLLDRKSKLESSSARGKKTRKTPSALKHGAYTNTAVLDGEDPKEFEKLHRDLIAEFAPQGTFEEHIIANMARLMWRKQNLASNRLATARLQQIRSPHSHARTGVEGERTAPAGVAADVVAALEGSVERMQMASIDNLMKDLAVEERLDGLLDRCLKRLLMVRGLKSLGAGE